MKTGLSYDITATLAIMRASLTAIFKNPSSIFFGILFPVIFILAFGFLSGSKSKFEVVLTDNSDTENYLLEQVENFPGIEIKKESDYEHLNEGLEKGKVDAVLNISELSNGKILANLQTSAAEPENGASVIAIINGLVDKKNIEDFKSQTGDEATNINLTLETIKGREYKSIDFLLPGQLGFALLNSGVFGTAFLFLELRKTLVIKRYFATPVKKAHILFGEGAARLIFSLFQASIIILIGVVLFNFTLINGVETFLSMLLLTVLGLTVFLGMGFVVSSLAKDENSLPPIANIITLPQFILSGTFFSTDIFPDWLQFISKLLPLTHLNDALRQVAFDGVSIFSLYREIGVLMLSIVITYAIALKIFRWEE